MGCRCDRCGAEWIPREVDTEPKFCPACKSPYWNTPRKRSPPLTYEVFRDRIRSALRRADRELTWTEVRAEANLPQALPNNQWVHKLERDIGLERKKDGHGIIQWRLK